MIVTRFAPSPTGRLHKGHAFSAHFAARAAAAAGGRFLLRIEDIDPVRCKPEFIDGIYEDLAWLGLSWEAPVRVQSQHLEDYAAALERLRKAGLVYPCYCTRKEVEAEAAAAGHAPQMEEGSDPAEIIYTGTCRSLTSAERAEKEKTRKPVWRLDMQRALRAINNEPLRWRDRGAGEVTARPDRFGDVVLARRDVPTSYHLSVVVDDALQGVTLVTRGRDLMASTDVHVLLQRLLGLPQPEYHHHALLLDENGKRLAKRDRAATIESYRAEGGSVDKYIRTLIVF